MGTARMGTDPARSVVNEWGRSHDVKKLFIVDGSVFVTSAGVNPTRTIQALALYVADSIKQRLATLFD
jgi:choline dehydrogenase-like flavoprotein